MASDEQINNQERFNDLQRQSKDLLTDYNEGLLESSDFVNVITSRTSQLVDSIRDVNREKGKTLKADRDLTSSITKISDLTKSLSTPYNDMGKAIRDSSKATDLQARLSKDLALISEKINQEAVTYNGTQMTQLELAESYLATQSEIAQIEDKIANSRRLMSSVEQSSFDSIVKSQREKAEAERQYNKILESGDISLAAMGGKQKKINDLEREKNIAANNYAKALKSGNIDAIKLAEEELEIADKRAQSYMSQLPLVEQEFFKKKQIRDEARAGYDQEIKAAKELGHQGALNLAQDQDTVDSLRDEADAKKSLLSLDAQAFIEGQKANKELEATIGYLDEEEQRVRSIIQAQTLWNVSLGAVEGILKNFGLNNQLITVGLDEGAKAAQSMAEELTNTRREAKGAAKAAELEAVKAGQLLSSINADYQQALKDGDTARIESLSKEKAIAEERAKIANQDYAEAEAASSKANSFVAKLGGSFKVLGAGIKGTFKGMASEFKALALSAVIVGAFKKAFKLIGGGVITKFISDLKGKFTEGIDFLQKEFFSLQSYINDVNAGDSFLQQIEDSTAKIASNLGLGTSEARELVDQAREVSREVGMMPEELAAVTGELQQAFGTTQKFSTDTVKTMGELTNLFGLTNQEASEFVKLGKLSGQEAGEVVTETRAQIQALKERNNIAISEKAVMQEIAKSSALQRMNAEKFAGGIANAAFSAKKLGMEMSSVQGVADNLLSIEDSIAKEMEAELLIGRDLQLDKARQLALEGNLAGVAEEISGQIGSAADFAKMNVMQQEALAAAVGMTKEQLAETLETQELLAGSGFDDMSKAQEEFRKILKETGSEEEAIAAMRERGANDQLVNQFREISLGEKREQQQRDILEAQAAMAKAAGPLINAFNNLQASLKQIKSVIVTAMQPFFKSFGGMVGEGGKAFETMVLPYAKKLGEFMNDVGLRLVDIVRNNGPQIKAIFSGVLELFGSIYNVVGGVIKQLLGIKDSGASSKGFFESIRDTISVMIEKLQNVDITALTEKVRGFIDGVKNIFNFIFEKVGAIGDFLGKNKGITKMAGLGAFAFTVAPGAVKDIAGSVGSAITKKAAGGLKTLGSNLGNKLTEKLGLGKLFGSGGKKPTGGSSDPLFVQNVGESAGGGLMDMASRVGGRQAGIGGGFKKGFKGLMDYAKMALKPGRAGKVGRARLLRAGKGLLTGQGASFVGGTGKGAAQAAGKLAGSAGKIAGAAGRLGKVAGSLGKIAAGGGIGAVVGLAAEATLGHFQKKAEAAAGALDEQIAMTDDAGKAAELEQKRKAKLEMARNLEVASTSAKYAALGATIGSVIPGVGTAAGAAVGALIGWKKGLIDAEKERKYQKSEEAKFQKNYRRLQLRNARDRESIEQNALKLRLQAEKDAAKAQLAIQQEFTTQLEGIDLNVPLDGPNAAFEDLAKKMLDAGNITEEQFTQALEGTLTPLQLMNAASSKAANNLKDLYNVVGQAAAEQAGAAREAALAAQGTNAAILESEKALIEGFVNNAILLESSSKALFDQFGDQLTDGIDTYAAAALTGEDSDVGSGIADALREQLEEETGQSAEAINVALAGVAAQLEREGDFKLSSEEDLIKVQQMVAERLLQGVDAQSLEAEKAANKAEKAGQEFGLANTKTINALTKSQLETNTELQEAIKGMEGGNEQLQAILEDGQITTAEIDAIKAFMTSAATALAGQATTDLEAAKQLENFTNALGSAEQVDDFIIRPGEAPIKFNKDDLLVGGTELDSALGIESLDLSLVEGTETLTPPSVEAPTSMVETILNKFIGSEPTKETDQDNNLVQANVELKAEVKELKEIMAGFVQQMSQVVNRPVVVELDGNKVGESIGRNSFLVQ